ncbi:MAG: hypothetical protein ACR2H9_22000 [Longimicrobiaceae bacterium]
MARRPNYGAEKRQKELQRQKKKDEKDEKKRLKKEAAAAGNPSDDAEAGEFGAAGVEPESDEEERDPDARG